jgi:hypothetical protein
MARMREGRAALLASLRAGAHAGGAAGATPAAHAAAAVAAHVRQTLVEELHRSQAEGACAGVSARASPLTRFPLVPQGLPPTTPSPACDGAEAMSVEDALWVRCCRCVHAHATAHTHADTLLTRSAVVRVCRIAPQDWDASAAAAPGAPSDPVRAVCTRQPRRTRCALALALTVLLVARRS